MKPFDPRILTVIDVLDHHVHLNWAERISLAIEVLGVVDDAATAEQLLNTLPTDHILAGWDQFDVTAHADHEHTCTDCDAVWPDLAHHVGDGGQP